MEKLYRLSEHVYILPFNPNTDRPNIGYIRSSSDSCLFDVGCGPKTVSLLRSELKENGFVMPDKAVISHFHWDHCFASGYVNCTLMGSTYTDARIREIMAMDVTSLQSYIDDDNCMPGFCEEHLPMEYKNKEAVSLRPLDILTDGSYTVDLGDVHLDLLEVTSPHAEGQIVGYVREDKVLFIGDANSELIYGHDFIDDKDKRRQFYEAVNAFDFEYIVLSHFDVMSREEFLKLECEQLYN